MGGGRAERGADLGDPTDVGLDIAVHTLFKAHLVQLLDSSGVPGQRGLVAPVLKTPANANT